MKTFILNLINAQKNARRLAEVETALKALKERTPGRGANGTFQKRRGEPGE